MSLINEALKKAQRERATPGSPATPGTPPPASPNTGYSRTPSPHRPLPWGFILLVLGVVGGGTAIWFLKPGQQSAPNSGTIAQHSPATVPAPTRPPALPSPQPVVVAAAPTATPEPTPTIPPAEPLQSAQIQPSPAVIPTAAAPTPAPLRLGLTTEDPRVLAFLEAARINGVRMVADDAKLLMNNKVFRTGNVVDRELGLKLVRISAEELIFEDARGNQYHKPI